MRGLQSRNGLFQLTDRIIPARAGFTHTQPNDSLQYADHPRACGVYPTNLGVPDHGKDHPRACGVYLTGLYCDVVSTGSSPRVRGLPGDKSSPTYVAEDHPRACGVYYRDPVYTPVACGSSPRVRGLLHDIGDKIEEIRIIPARAGFTARVTVRKMWKLDHPRACGVYLTGLYCDVVSTGSSPRVRGLLWYVVACPCLGRIIPARAGFTC